MTLKEFMSKENMEKDNPFEGCEVLEKIKYSDYVNMTRAAVAALFKEDDNSFRPLSREMMVRFAVMTVVLNLTEIDGYDDIDADPTTDDPTSEAEFYLVKGLNVVETWQKWDLSGLGPVAKVRFNFLYSDEMGGSYGFTIPGYFAYDDIAVRFEE